MLSPHELELLTAHVDGELTPAERGEVAGLLSRSGEAREFLLCLEEDAARLRAAPRLSSPVDLSGDVLVEIGRLAQRDARRKKPTPNVVTFTAWRGFVAAAGVLLSLGLASYLLKSHRGSLTKSDDSITAKKSDANKDIVHKPEGGAIAKVGPDNENEGKSSTKTPDPEQGNKATNPSLPQATPQVPNSGVLAAKDDPHPRLERVEVDLPTFARLHELDKPEQARLLTERLANLSYARVELTTKHGSHAFEKLRKALESRKFNLHFDPATQARLQKPLARADLVVFAESVKAEALVEFLRDTALADRVEPHFDGAVVVKELGKWDRQHLQNLLGIDPTVTKVTEIHKSGLDIRREIPEQTTREVVAALDGLGVPRPGAELPHNAYVSHLPSTKSNRPKELQRFLALRQPPKNGTIHVLLIVLRYVG